MNEIRCADCSVTLGTVSVPSGAEIKRNASGTDVNPAMLAMLPKDIAPTILAFVKFRCPTCTTKEIFHNGSTQENSEEGSGKDSGETQSWSPFRRNRRKGDDGRAQ